MRIRPAAPAWTCSDQQPQLRGSRGFCLRNRGTRGIVLGPPLRVCYPRRDQPFDTFLHTLRAE